MLETLRQHCEVTPQSPSERLGKPISAELEALILQCLAKSPADRPPSAVALAEALDRCQPLVSWTSVEATRWWNEFEAMKTGGPPPETAASPPLGSTVRGNDAESVATREDVISIEHS